MLSSKHYVDSTDSDCDVMPESEKEKSYVEIFEQQVPGKMKLLMGDIPHVPYNFEVFVILLVVITKETGRWSGMGVLGGGAGEL